LKTRTLLKKSHHKELFTYMTLDGNFSYVIEKPASNIVYFHALGILDRLSFRNLCKRIFIERTSDNNSQFFIIANVENLKSINQNAIESLISLLHWSDRYALFNLTLIGNNKHVTTIENLSLQKISISYTSTVEEALESINAISNKNYSLDVSKVTSGLFSKKNILSLSESANYSSLIDHTQDIICLIDQEYKIQITNAAFDDFLTQNFGISISIGENFMDILRTINIKNGEDFFAKVIDGQRFNFTYILPKDEGNAYFEVSLNPVFGQSSEINGISFFMHDISKLKRTEESLKRSQQLMASINTNIKEGIYRSNEDTQIIYVNPAFVEMFGYNSEEELLNTPFSNLYKDASERNRLISYIKKHDKLSNREVKFKRKDGSIFWGLITSMRTQDESGQEYYDGAIRNITKIKDAEDKLKKQNLELKKVNRELDRFVYSASHDLRAPLSSILGLIGVTRLENDQQARDYCLQLMEKSVHKLDSFIKDIINYSRNKRLLIGRDPINFKPLLENIFTDLQYIKKSTRVEKIIEVNNDELFVTDERRLKIVLFNLISNSIIYSATIREPLLKVEVNVKNGKATIVVSDNGQGIGEEHLDRVFEMFYRASEEQAGSGLGLYIAKETIEQLNGTIEITSAAGTGTIATVTLPSLN
jgi:PAS domain S-box-containing protein